MKIIDFIVIGIIIILVIFAIKKAKKNRCSNCKNKNCEFFKIRNSGELS